MALNALAKVYKQEVTYSGPIYDSMKIEDGKIIIKFSNTDGGLISKGITNYWDSKLPAKIKICLGRSRNFR